MKRLIIAALLCAATLAQADTQAAPDAAHNPKGAALLRAQYKKTIWLYDYTMSDAGKHSVNVFPQSIKPLGDNWVAVVSEHKPKQRKDTPTIQFLDWVHCGAQPDSVMMTLVFLNPKRQPVKLMDVHPAASPKELDV